MTLRDFISELNYTLAKSEEIDRDRYRKRLYTAISNAQRSVAQIARIVREYAFYHDANSLRNLYTGKKTFAAENEKVSVSVAGGRCYTFSADGPCKITIDCSGTLTVIEKTGAGIEFFDGRLAGDAEFLFEGEHRFNISNFAVYDKNYALIPRWCEYVPYRLPADFDRFVSLGCDTAAADYYVTDDYVYVKRDVAGRYLLRYCAMPARIYYNADNDKTSDGYQLEVSENAQRIMLDAVAAALMQNNYDLRHFTNYFSKYQGELANYQSGAPGAINVCQR